METTEYKKTSITDYLSIIYKWKKFFIIAMIIVVSLSVIYVFIVPQQYRATASFMIPASKNFGLGGLGGLLSGESSALDIGTRLLGVTNTNEDMVMGFMYSRPIISKIAEKYNLYEYYDIEDSVYEDLAGAFFGDIQVDPNEYGFIDVSVINKEPKIAAQIANDFIIYADSLNVKFNAIQATNYKDFVEKRYFQTLADLKKAEEAYYEFQTDYGVVDIPEQVKALIESTSQLEAQIIKNEILLANMENEYGTNSPQYYKQKFQLEQLKQQLKNLYGGKSADDFFIAKEKIPDLQIEYLRNYRELEIQNQTLKYIYPIVEQARIDEKKNMPTTIVINEAVAPQKRYSPKRKLIVMGTTFIFFWIVVGIIFRGEKILNMNNDRKNIIEEKEYKFYKSITSKLKMPV